MKERPILFSAPMVRAILDGGKTQTRRVVKSQPEFVGPESLHCAEVALWQEAVMALKSPYGQPGDRLWVRETFQPTFAPGIKHGDADWTTGEGYQPRYMATDERVEWIDADDNITNRCKPAIHMPRWASRITLEVTGVRVERLQDISDSDAWDEGIDFEAYTAAGGCKDAPRVAFGDLWERINGPGSWEANPWVWVVEFKKLETING